MPLGLPFAIGEPRVEHGHVVAEAGAKPARELGSERDLGNERDGTFPLLPRPGDRFHVHEGLAAPGRAVQQEWREGGRLERRAELTERRELGGARPQGASAPGRVRSPQWSRWFVADRRQTPGYQPAQVRPGSGECRKELLDRHACLVAGEKPGQHLRLPRRSGRRLRAWNRGGDFHVGRRPRRDGDAAKLDESPFLQCLQTGPGHGFAVRHRLQQHAGARRRSLRRGKELGLRRLDELPASLREDPGKLLLQAAPGWQGSANGEPERRQIVRGGEAA